MGSNSLIENILIENQVDKKESPIENTVSLLEINFIKNKSILKKMSI